MIVILMGVSGCGKSTVGEKLAEELDWVLIDGDDFHSPENISKMKSGIPLEDEDRLPWLESLGKHIQQLETEGKSAVVVCSVLKKSYRKILRDAGDSVVFVFLKGSMELIQKRLEQRPGHFMPVELLESQFRDLEEPEDAIEIDINQTLEEVVSQAKEALMKNLP